MSEPAPPKFDFKKSFIQSIKDTQRVWSHNRALTLGASETFTCLRRAYYLKFHPELAEINDDGIGYARRGDIIENYFVVPVLKHIFGDEHVQYASDDQESFVSGLNSATPDALVFPHARDILAKYGIDDIESDCFCTEIKSFDPLMHLEEEKAFHRGQGIMQLGMFRELTEHQPMYVVILYVNASNLADIRPYVVRFDPIIYAAGKARAKKVFSAKEAYDLPAEGMHNGQCDNCPFMRACRGEEYARAHIEVHALELDAQEIFSALAQQYLEAHEAEKAAKEAKSRCSEEIKRLLSAFGTKSVDTGDYKVTNSRMPGKASHDLQAMENDGIDVDKYRSEGAPFTRLSVKKKAAKKKDA